MENRPSSLEPRRILIFSLAYFPHFVGGAEVAVKEITDRISAKDIVFDMVTLGKSQAAPDKIGNVNVYRVGLASSSTASGNSRIPFHSKIAYIWLAYRQALLLNGKNRYDAVWSIMASYAGYAAHLFKRKNPGIPFVLSIQEGDNFKRRKGLLGRYFKRIFKSADIIQAISRFLADWSRDMGADCPVEVVPNGVDYEHFSRQRSSEELSDLRLRNGVRDNEILLLTASRLVYKNAVDDIISALAHLDHTYKLMILGSGPLKSQLESQVIRLKLAPRVIFAGFVSHDELPQYLQAADIFVRPSRSEGLGNSFLEAMAAGVPVIATPVGGIPDFLVEGETGLYCEIDDPQSIALRVQKLARDPESRQYIVTRARNMVEKKYRWETISRRMREIFLTPIGTRSEDSEV